MTSLSNAEIRPEGVPDHEWSAACRLAERVALHLLADREGAPGRWMAVRLSDGGGDDTLYATRDEAISHQLHPGYMTFVRLAPTAMSPRSAHTFLRMSQHMHSNGQRFDIAGCIPILPQRRELAARVFRWRKR